MVRPLHESAQAAGDAGGSGSRPRVRPATPEEVQAGRETIRPGYRLSFILEPDGTVRQVTQSSGVDSFPQEGLVGMTLGEISTKQAGTERGDMWDVRIELAKQASTPVQYLDPVPGSAHDAPRTVGSTVTPVRTVAGELQAIVVDIEDISVDAKANRQLRDSEARFRSLAETLPMMVWESDGAGNARFLSKRWIEFSGKSIHELLGRGYQGLIHPDDRAHLGAARDAGQSQGAIPFRLLRHDGVYRWVEAFVEVVRDANGNRVQAIGSAIDVTDRREADDRARELHEQLVRALGITGLGRYSVDVAESRVTIDERGVQILGIDREELRGPGGYGVFLDALYGDDVGPFQHAFDAAVSEDADLDLEVRVWRQGEDDAELRWIAIHGRIDREGSGSPRLLGLIEDVTDRRREEEARVRSQKREMMGTLVGGIAHDFNNVISAIVSNASVARSELAAGASVETSLTEIERGAQRAAELVRRVLSHGREEETTLLPIDVAAIADEACALVRPGLGAQIDLVQTVERPLPKIAGDATQLHQLVVNLVTNAGQAIGDAAGRINVRVESSDERSATNPRRAAGVVLTVRDDGPGMPESVRRRVFDPYFTTKPAGKGTGLGLSACQTIVRTHRGTIDVESEPGSHTTFVVRFPALEPEDEPRTGAAGAPTATGTPAPTPASGSVGGSTAGGDRSLAPEPSTDDALPAGTTSVLFVDDEPSLVRLAERAMPASGLNAVGYIDAEEALQAFVAAPEQFDALVTDLSMPSIDGLTLIEGVRRARPDVPVILTSGFMTPAHRARARALGVDRVVPKPCSMADLAAAVRAVLPH